MQHSGKMFLDFGPNSGYVQELYELYSSDKTLVSPHWIKYFEEFEKSLRPNRGSIPNGGYANGGSVEKLAPLSSELNVMASQAIDLRLQDKVYDLISSYRQHGHLKAKINPLTKGINPLPQSADLEMEYYGFSSLDLEKTVSCAGFKNQSQMKLRDLIEELNLFIAKASVSNTHTYKVKRKEAGYKTR